jgi:methylthioribose-1-phosphate isomerase
MARTLYWEDGAAMILDQTKLPDELTYVKCIDTDMVAECIINMRIRGAPAIGIATAMGIALGAQAIKGEGYGDFVKDLESVYKTLLATRPTAVNIEWAVDRMRSFLENHKSEPVETLKEMLIEEAGKVLEEDIEINKAIGRYGAVFVKDGARILTHCNAGGLATGGYGTATAPMRTAHAEGKKIHVYADETRPLLQGARLTSWELKEDGIPVTLITDNCAGALMNRGEIDLVIVGTDRTARNGDVANKIGTYMVAVLAKENGIPFYVAAPTSSIDFSMPSGDMIPIEERAPEEVTKVHGKVSIAPEGISVRNLAFDVTPAKYVTAIITEKGAFRPEDLKNLDEEGADLEKLRL